MLAIKSEKQFRLCGCGNLRVWEVETGILSKLAREDSRISELLVQMRDLASKYKVESDQ